MMGAHILFVLRIKSLSHTSIPYMSQIFVTHFSCLHESPLLQKMIHHLVRYEPLGQQIGQVHLRTEVTLIWIISEYDRMHHQKIDQGSVQSVCGDSSQCLKSVNCLKPTKKATHISSACLWLGLDQPVTKLASITPSCF